MDLIYMNGSKEDIGVMKDYLFDLAFGTDENDFEVKINRNKHCCEGGFFLYMEGTEYGGIIDDIETDTELNEVIYHGRTWHGFLDSKCIEPLKLTDESTNEVIVHKCGKNLLNPTLQTTTKNGVTCTNNGDGTYTLNGNATNDIWFNFATVADTDMVVGEMYCFSALEQDNSNILLCVDNGGNSRNARITYQLKGSNGFVSMKVSKDATFSDFLIKPMITTDLNATYDDFKPYESMAGKYLIVSGEANKILTFLIDRLGIGSLFAVSTEDSGIMIKNFKFDRYTMAYKGIVKMLKSNNAKLKLNFCDGLVIINAKSIVDYSKDEQLDSDLISMKIKKYYSPVNHLICLGKGELDERQVIHLYTDANGNISHTQSLTGIHEVVEVYDYSSVESLEDLEAEGVKVLKEAWNRNSIETNFDSDSNTFDIGDIVGGIDHVTGMEGKAEITKKIVTINDNETTISYKVGGK